MKDVTLEEGEASSEGGSPASKKGKRSPKKEKKRQSSFKMLSVGLKQASSSMSSLMGKRSPKNKKDGGDESPRSPGGTSFSFERSARAKPLSL